MSFLSKTASCLDVFSMNQRFVENTIKQYAVKYSMNEQFLCLKVHIPLEMPQPRPLAPTTD